VVVFTVMVGHCTRDVEIIILDERSCRSPDVESECMIDLAPTAPGPLRLLAGLPSTPPAGCLEAIFDPSRTMLGQVQKDLFKSSLLNSSATFKFIFNEVPIQQLYALPYDRWEGYAFERSEILNFIRDNKIENVIFLTTDLHASLINQVFIDNFADPEPIAHELVTGPIATRTFEEGILDRWGNARLVAANLLFNILGMDCRHLNTFSYGLVDVDAAAGTATITLKDDSGVVLLDQLNPSTTACTTTIGN